MLDRLVMTQCLYDYLFAASVREPDVLRRLREETSTLPEAEMQVPSEQGQFLGFLVKLIGAKKTMEVGVFTGYSALWTALALPVDGRLVACDTSREWTTVAQRYWEEAGVADKIDLRLGPALGTMDLLLREGQGNSFDLVFIDADKVSYLEYYERALELARPGGLIILDNVLRSGEVIDLEVTEPGTVTIRALNEKLHDDERIMLSMLPIADGVTLANKL